MKTKEAVYFNLIFSYSTLLYVRCDLVCHSTVIPCPKFTCCHQEEKCDKQDTEFKCCTPAEKADDNTNTFCSSCPTCGKLRHSEANTLVSFEVAVDSAACSNDTCRCRIL